MRLNFHITNITSKPFDNPHIKSLILRYIRRLNELHQMTVSICDPFANDSARLWEGAMVTSNDINTEFETTYNMEANDFGEEMERKGRMFDLVLFDPPYSLRQLKDCYAGVGKDLDLWQTQNMWGRCKNALAQCIPVGGYVIHLGWHSHGFGKNRGFEKVEMMVCEQAGKDERYNVLVTVEQKTQASIFDY